MILDVSYTYSDEIGVRLRLGRRGCQPGGQLQLRPDLHGDGGSDCNGNCNDRALHADHQHVRHLGSDHRADLP